MTSRRRFNSLVHNLLDRAYYPYGFPNGSVEILRELCQSHGYNCVTIDLHHPPPAQQALPLSRELLFGLAYLHRKYYGLLLSEGFTPADVHSATITYHFSQPLDDGMGEYFDVPIRGHEDSRWWHRRKFLYAVNIRVVDDLGKLHQSWQMPYGCKRILKRPEKLEEIKFTPNEEVRRAPVLYVEDVSRLAPNRSADSYNSCVIALGFLAVLAILAALVYLFSH